MSDNDRQVHIGNYTVTKESLSKYLKLHFGPCLVKDPLPQRNEKQDPFGFVVFENPEKAKACIESRTATIQGQTVVFSPAKYARPDHNNPNGAGAPGNNFSFGEVPSNITSPSSRNHSSKSSVSPLSQETVQKYKAILSHSNGIDELYIQNVSGNRAVNYLKLQTELKQHCQQASVVSNIQPNQMYAALFSEDESWYRCVVLSISGSSYVVQFVDYGNQSTVQKNEIKVLPAAMSVVPPAAAKHHLKDLIVKVEHTEKVKELLNSWQEVLLECEEAADNSVDLINKETGKSLRSELQKSSYVTLPLFPKSPGMPGESRAGEGDNGNCKTNAPRSQKNKKKNKSASNLSSAKIQQDAGDTAAVQALQSQCTQQESTISKLNTETSTLKKQLTVANKKIQQLSAQESIDELNTELYRNLALVKKQRSQLAASNDGMLEQVITILSDAKFTQAYHDEIFAPVLTLHSDYLNQQEQIRNSVNVLDEELINSRNETRALFCKAAETCQGRFEELSIPDRRTQLHDLMEKLSALYPSIATADFSGDIDEAITNYTQWLVTKCEHVKEVQKATDKSLDSLSQQLNLLQQGLVINSEEKEGEQETGTTEDGSKYNLEESTKLVIYSLKDELECGNNMSDGPTPNTVIKSLCQALRTKICTELALLDTSHTQMLKIMSLANDIQPHIGITQPADLNWYQQKEKKLKELRSKLRHKMADLDDLRENDDEDVSDTEVKGAEQEVQEIRDNIHSLLIEMEDYLQNLSQLSRLFFPEFVLQYPKMNLQVIQSGAGFIKTLRDISFYKDTSGSSTTFNKKPVVLKTLPSAGAANVLPEAVCQIKDCPELKGFFNVDAVFFSKNGTTTYIQLSSSHDKVLDHLLKSQTLDVDALKLVTASISMEPSDSTCSNSEEEVAENSSSEEINIS